MTASIPPDCWPLINEKRRAPEHAWQRQLEPTGHRREANSLTAWVAESEPCFRWVRINHRDGHFKWPTGRAGFQTFQSRQHGFTMFHLWQQPGATTTTNEFRPQSLDFVGDRLRLSPGPQIPLQPRIRASTDLYEALHARLVTMTEGQSRWTVRSVDDKSMGMALRSTSEAISAGSQDSP